ncbi:phage GP46 family protein [Pseudomonas putida]|nr:phage GP46 family protein [Pseudomonas putida]MBI6944196.1 phage GP46 family protein [Pseudomonas putida]MBI6960362.1 phage GP46 family protein [Pseudomonas putida]
MTDIATVWIAADGQGDWAISMGALASGSDLASAVLISLFTDRQATADDDLPDTTGDRRGWWADVGQAVAIGSRLWLLNREKLTDDVAKKAVIYAKEALAWMIDDGIATAIDVAPTVERNRLDLVVTITRAGGAESFRYAWAWSQVQ